jgi:subtilisin family serine protease
MASKKFVSAHCAIALAVAAVTFGAPMLVQAQTAAKQERVIVSFKAGQGAAVRAAIARAGGRVVVELDEFNAVAVRLPASAVAGLKRHGSVASIEADPLRRLMGGKSTSVRRGSGNAVQDAESAPYGIGMVQADQVSFNAAGGRKLCIIDSGFNLGHEDLQTSGLSGVDLTLSPAPGTSWNTDENSHGTHVAGTIAALGGNGIGVVGVVPGGTLPLHIAKVFDASGSASSSAILKGVLNCAKARANVISMSLGGGRPNNLETKVYDAMAKRGILVIAAAGNAGDTTTSYPAGYASVMSVAAIDINKVRADFSQVNADVEIAGPGVATLSTVPQGSQLESVVTVGGTPFKSAPMDGSPLSSANGALANFGIGDTPVAGSMAGKVCLVQRGGISFADKVLNCKASGGVGAVIYNNVPGMLFGTMGGIATTIPSAGASDTDGALMVNLAGQATSVAVQVSAANYAEYSGTSMATPHVSAVAALVWSNFPACSPAQIRNALNMSAMDLGTAGRDNEYGNGLVQAKAAVNYLMANSCAAP